MPVRDENGKLIRDSKGKIQPTEKEKQEGYISDVEGITMQDWLFDWPGNTDKLGDISKDDKKSLSQIGALHAAGVIDIQEVAEKLREKP